MPILSLFETVPTEIIELIIDSLATDKSEVVRMNALKACSQTCQAFLPICRKHIFHSVDLHRDQRIWPPIYKQQLMVNRYARLIADNPTIAEYIQIFQYNIHFDHFEVPFSQVPFGLEQLKKLKSFSLVWDQPRGSSWSAMVPPMRSCLLRLIHLPTLVSLHLSLIDGFNPEYLLPCTGLKELTLYRVTGMTEDDEHDWSKLPAKRFQLAKLKLHHEIDVKAAASLTRKRHPDRPPLLDLQDLKEIFIFVSEPSNIPIVSEIIKQTRHLESMSFFVPEECHAAALTSTISASAKTLKYLSFDIYIDNNHVDPLSGLCQILQEIAGRNQIKTLNIGIEIQTDETCRTGDEWGMLEKVILGPGWSFLTQLKLSITINSFGRNDDKDLENALGRLPETQFPRLSSSKSLKFKFSVSEYLV